MQYERTIWKMNMLVYKVQARGQTQICECQRSFELVGENIQKKQDRRKTNEDVVAWMEETPPSQSSHPVIAIYQADKPISQQIAYWRIEE